MNNSHFPQRAVLLILLLFTSSRVRALNDLRLRLADAAQVQRTTSVNWWDLTPAKKSKSTEGQKYKILIDAGHGGYDLGAVGRYDILEKELVLKVARQVKSRLESQAKLRGISVDVRLTRSDDTFLPLRERVRIANEWNADLFVSVHANSSEAPKAQGFEVYFLSNDATDADAKRVAKAENQESHRGSVSSPIESILSDLRANIHVNQSSRFAEVVYQQMARSIRANVNGVRQAPFVVLEGTEMPALLVEIGYVTHQTESRLLTDPAYLKKISRAISSGIVEFAATRKRVG